MDTSGITVILSETQPNTIKPSLDKAKIIVDADKAKLLQDTYAELIRRTSQI